LQGEIAAAFRDGVSQPANESQRIRWHFPSQAIYGNPYDRLSHKERFGTRRLTMNKSQTKVETMAIDAGSGAAKRP
jgi:hypothetical protein